MHGISFPFISVAFGILAVGHAFCPAAGVPSLHRIYMQPVHGYYSSRHNSRQRHRRRPTRDVRTRLFESVSQNREKIDRAMSRLRDAMRSEDHELAERLKAFIMHLRKRDPQFSTQDALDDALAKGLFSTAAKLKLRLTEINQNPFRQGLLSDAEQDVETPGGNPFDVSSRSGVDDVAEDMSWGFDQSFMGGDEEGRGAEDDDDYDDI